LGGIGLMVWRQAEQAVDASSVHQVGAHQPGEGKWGFHRKLGGLRKAQQQESNKGYGDLSADGVFTGPEEMANFQGLFDPAEEQFDGPAALVEIGDLGRSIEVVAQDAQNLAALELDPNLADRLVEQVAPALGVQ